jgi:pimeloyl-ACP methyl ester carboxylesterase
MTAVRRSDSGGGRKRLLVAQGAFLVMTVTAAAAPATLQEATDGTRAKGLRAGPHAVGFEVIAREDRTRRINHTDAGTWIGLAVWYPARRTSDGPPAMTAMDYRLTQFRDPPTAAQRTALEDDEVGALVAWRHVGIVPLTDEQARSSLATRGVAVKSAPPAAGRFPVVLLFGGPYYLSTTAEILASHGFLVVAPFRFSDQSNEVGTRGFTWSLENSVRDAEWGLEELRADPRADVGYVSALGHGGGGLQAMLFAMRNPTVNAVVNIDAGNFSTRSQPRSIPFYNPRLMRAPYLFIVTADTRKGLDLFDDFAAMRFSDRTEVTLESPGLRHHDLSDIGRAVTAPMGIRGEAQAEVQAQYAGVQEMVVRFLEDRSGARKNGAAPFAEWARTLSVPAHISVTVRPGTTPAPTAAALVRSLDAGSVASLKAARSRDPEADVFTESALSGLIAQALASGDLKTAAALGDLAIDMHPASAILLAQASRVAEAGGNRSGAIAAATTCAQLHAENDWRATAAIGQCRDRLERLGRTPVPR